VGKEELELLPIEDEARRALDGDRDALDIVVRALQGDIYGFALRMLSNREYAEDATQEILVRIVTRLLQCGELHPRRQKESSGAIAPQLRAARRRSH
jgi:DNA-directed RNA polymerase specialized sigma24 family protein